MSTVLWILLIVALLVMAFRMWSTANRLDRLHIRTNAAWVALDGALQRRSAVIRSAAAAGAFDPETARQAREITAGVDDASTDRSVRAQAENEVSRWLSATPLPSAPDLAAELVDAAQRVSLARRFHNDAVRDTRALRAKRFTRWFRLAGRAVMPEFFEIADTTFPVPRERTAARVLLFDPQDRLLLCCSRDPGKATPESIWFAPGGGLEPGESLPDAAVRELAEETGRTLDPGALAGPLWRRRVRFTFDGTDYDQTEFYLLARVDEAFVPDTSGYTELEQRGIVAWRWFSADEVASCPDTVYPTELAGRLAEARHAASGHPIPPLSAIS